METPLPTHHVSVPLPMNTKYVTGNPIGRRLIRGFMATLSSLIRDRQLSNILEVGCGEGLVLRQIKHLYLNTEMHGLDIEVLLLHAARAIFPTGRYVEGSIYGLPMASNSYDAVICTEVLEHLEAPEVAVQEIVRVTRKYSLFSVPHEPWWRVANVARGSYWSALGNTPGHVNHWTSGEFVQLISSHLDVIEVRRPFPWTMVLAEKRGIRAR